LALFGFVTNVNPGRLRYYVQTSQAAANATRGDATAANSKVSSAAVETNYQTDDNSSDAPNELAAVDKAGLK
jgi:hypothetical protein